MQFQVFDKEKVVVGYNPKCGSSHIKNICNFIRYDEFLFDAVDVHKKVQEQAPPENIEDYSVIIIGRNPYHRIISLFKDKYAKGAEFRNLWNKHCDEKALTFTNFVTSLINDNPAIDRHHTMPQFSKISFNFIKSKQLFVFDLPRINYGVFYMLFNKAIPQELKDFRGSHKTSTENDQPIEDDSFLGDIHIDELPKGRLENKRFFHYRNLAYMNNFYRIDFELFSFLGLGYQL